ncbi:MAG: SRPBCC domain-containing protein [Nocardioides sp.]
MRFYEVRRTISAPPDVVWGILTDAERLVAADVGIARIDGRIQEGSRFTLWSDAVPGRGFRTRVARLDPPLHMEWVGGLPAGLFRGRRVFELVPRGQSTDFSMREEFTGALLPVIWRTMPDLQPSFDTFASGLARASEETP